MQDNDFCPICLEKYDRDASVIKDGNDNHDFETKSSCHHWFCSICLKKMYYKSMFNCPLCRESICELVTSFKTKLSLNVHGCEYIKSEDNTECPLCLKTFAETGNMQDYNGNVEIESYCQHVFCSVCLYDAHRKSITVCPLCQGDIGKLALDTYYYLNTYSEDDDDGDGNDDEDDDNNDNDDDNGDDSDDDNDDEDEDNEPPVRPQTTISLPRKPAPEESDEDDDEDNEPPPVRPQTTISLPRKPAPEESDEDVDNDNHSQE